MLSPVHAGGGSGAGESTGVGASSPALLLCSAVLLCIGCQQVAAQAKAEHTSLPPALPDHYSLLVLVNMRRYTQKHAYIYTRT